MSSWGPESQDFESGLLGESTQPITVLFPLRAHLPYRTLCHSDSAELAVWLLCMAAIFSGSSYLLGIPRQVYS